MRSRKKALRTARPASWSAPRVHVAYGIMLVAAASHGAVAIDDDPTLKAWIDRGRPIVAAGHRYKDRHGLWQQRLEDLAPEFLSEPPAAIWRFQWNPEGESTLRVKARSERSSGLTASRTLVYVFGGDDQGWYIGDESGFEPLEDVDRFPIAVTRSKEKTVVAATAELKRRIQREPQEEIHHQALVSLLYRAGRLEQAREACLDWIRAHPREFNPRYALIAVEKKLRSGLGIFDSDHKLARKAHPTFAVWRLYNNPLTNTGAFDALRHAIQLPLAANESEWAIAEMAAYIAAEFAYSVKRYRLAVEICNAWEKEAKRRGGRVDASYLTLRAASSLALGELQQARADVEAAIAREQAGFLWAGNTRALKAAVVSDARAFRYEVQQDSGYQAAWFIDPR